MMFSVRINMKLKLTNEMARDKIVKMNDMKIEDPFCAELY
jgi:hypothetical protein